MNRTSIEGRIIISDYNILFFLIFIIFLINILRTKLNNCYRINKSSNISIIDLSSNNLSSNNLTENLIDISNNEIDELPSYSEIYPSK